MYLEKLEIQGFKSFAYKNKLIFSHQIDARGRRGLTAIVGPNGSGKSNIADAVRWVLGEQSLKTLRGKKSEDVIFSGSDQKSRLGMAEVSLYLNNGEKNNKKEKKEDGEEEKDASGNSLSPLDYDQIVITRRLFRNGDSEYLLNNNKVRLSDIQILLAKANVGQKTYSVIGQGMVENFLNTGAAERKDFFDEATGVKQFQIKRDLALNKLESSYDNLQQVEMLLGEIKPRLKMLTRQVERLKKRGQIENELISYQKRYYHRLWQDIDKKLSSAQERLQKLQEKQEEKEGELEKIKIELDSIKRSDNSEDIEKLKTDISEARKKQQEINRRISRLNAELELQLEASGNFDLSWLNQKSSELKEERRNLEEGLATLPPSKSKEEEEIREEISRLNGEIEKRQSLRQELTAKQEEKSQLSKSLDRLEAQLEASLEASGNFDLSWLENKKTELSGEIEKRKTELEQIDYQEKESTLTNKEEEKKKLDEILDKAKQELKNINQELANSSKPAAGREEINRSINAFLERLENIKQEENIGRIRQLIEEAKEEFQKQIRSLIDGENEEKLEKARKLQADIIEHSEKQQKLAENIAQLQLELSAKKERKRSLEQNIESLRQELNGVEDKIKEGQVKFNAEKIKKEQKEIKEKIDILNKEEERLRQASDYSEIEKKKQETSESLNEIRLFNSSREEKIRLYKERIQQNDNAQRDIQEKIEKSQVKFDSVEIEKQKDSLNQDLEKLEAEINAWQSKLNEYEAQKEEEKRSLFNIQGRSQTSQQELNRVLEELNSVKIDSARQETRLEDLNNNIENDSLSLEKIKSYQEEEKENGESEEEQRRIINRLKSQLEQIGGIDPEVEKEFTETDERYSFLSKQTEDLDNTINSLEKVIGELDINIRDKFEKEFKIISEKFSQYFKILFNGGQAKIFKLEQLEEEDKEEDKNDAQEKRKKKIKALRKNSSLGLAGIEIQATPPGKKIQSISMLSGGERALTAIALICAIISANPSPFVVLDEVDAALDEANSERLAQILDELSEKTQFVTITHNRASMKRANILYGVTMKADGVSQLLSVRLSDIIAKQG